MSKQGIWWLRLVHDQIRNGVNEQFESGKHLPTDTLAPARKMNQA
jgi:hypothetical protein